MDPAEIGKLLSQLGQMMQGAGSASVGWPAAVNMARTNEFKLVIQVLVIQNLKKLITMCNWRKLG